MADAQVDATKRRLVVTRHQLSDLGSLVSAQSAEIARMRGALQTAAAQAVEQQAALEAANEATDRAIAAAAAATTPVGTEGGVSAPAPMAHVNGASIIGDGVLEIGTVVAPGQWHTDGGVGCYYAVLNSIDNTDIQSDATPAGPADVDLPAGKFFETLQCGTWTRRS